MFNRIINGFRRKRAFFLINKIYVGTKNFEKKRKLLNSIGFKIGEVTKIVGPVEIYGQLTVGKNTWIGKNFTVNGNGKVEIGDNCDIGPEATFQTGGHKIGSAARRAGEGMSFSQVVESGSWIGGRSTILNETVIGSGCVVAGCSCVTKSVEKNTMVGGVPAKLIRKLDD